MPVELSIMSAVEVSDARPLDRDVMAVQSGRYTTKYYCRREVVLIAVPLPIILQDTLASFYISRLPRPWAAYSGPRILC